MWTNIVNFYHFVPTPRYSQNMDPTILPQVTEDYFLVNYMLVSHQCLVKNMSHV